MMTATRPAGQVLYFRSRIGDRLQPCGVCATDTSDEPKALILEVSPRASAGNLQPAVELVEAMAGGLGAGEPSS